MHTYGGDPMQWLHTPACVVSAHLRMIPVLEAEGAMLAATVTAVGTSAEAGPWVGGQWQEWQRQAGRRAPRPAATPAALAAVGVGVRVVQKGRRSE